MQTKNIRIPSGFVIFFVYLLGMFTVLLILYKPFPVTPKSIEFPTMIPPVKIDHSFDFFFTEIKKDIARKNIEIRLMIGPYYKYRSILMAIDLYYAPDYYILADEEFFNELTFEEKKGAIAHEIGHILFGSSYGRSRKEYTANEALVDKFATKYVSPESIMGLLEKAYSDHIIRKRGMEILVQQGK